ncbi:MAG: bile acid:sodium symporter [Vulcanococcus sp.]
MPAAFSALIAATLFAAMLALGLNLRLEALLAWGRRPVLPLRVLLGSCVLVPLAGLLLLQSPWSNVLSPPMRVGMALMAICPSAPLTLRPVRNAGADHQLAALSQVGAACVAIVSVPLMELLFRSRFGVEGWIVQPDTIALQVGRVQVLPLLLGLGLRHWRPRVANRLERPLDAIANGLLLVMLTVLLLKVGPLLLGFLPANGPGLLAIALMVAVAMLLGWVISADQREHRTTAMLLTALRNPGLALLLANRAGEPIHGVNLAILLYALLTALISQAAVRR